MKKRLLMLTLCLAMSFTAFGCESSDSGKDKDRSSRSEKDVDDEDEDEDEDEDKDKDEDDKDSHKKDKNKKGLSDKDEDEDKDEDKDESEDKKDKEDKEDKKDEEDDKPGVSSGREEKKSNDVLTDNIYDYQLSFDGTVVTFPISFADFESLGFECTDDETSQISANSYALMYFEDSNKNKVMGYVMNFGINSTEASNCYVVGAEVTSYFYKNGEVQMAGGLKFGEATLEDVEELFGGPSDNYEGTYITYTYKEDYYELVEVKFDPAEGNKLVNITVKNFTEPEGFEAGAVDTSMPAITAAYVAPKELSDDLRDYTVDFGGKVYQLPCPVQELIDDGWEIVGDKSVEIVSGSSSGKVTLRRDNKEFYSYVTNYDADATLPEYCFVTEFEASNYSTNKKPDIEITISGGIQLGISAEELEKKLSGCDYEKEDSSSGSVYYTIKDSRSTLFYTSIYVNDGIVKNIEVKYSPKKSDYRKEMGVD